MIEVLEGDCRAVMATMPEASVDCIVTSPPYFGLRDYGIPASVWADGWTGCLGLEPSPDMFVAHMVEVFAAAWRVLKPQGTLWLNMGDSYATKGGPGWQGKNGIRADRRFTGTRNTVAMREQSRTAFDGYKPKDLMGVPWMLAFALRADGWWLRQEIIWHKPNPMPESIKDRCTKAHEHLFLLAKSELYFYDADAIAEPVSENTHARYAANGGAPPTGAAWGVGDEPRTAVELSAMKTQKGRKRAKAGSGIKNNESFDKAMKDVVTIRNKRSVWSVVSEPFSGAHFATFPPKLIEPCILAGCPENGTVLDPFGGAGTTGLVADRNHRNAVLIEIGPQYAEMARARIRNESPLFAEIK